MVFTVNGRDANADPDQDEDTDDGYATTTVVVSFKYHVSDVFTVNQRAGTTAGPDQNRAKVHQQLRRSWRVGGDNGGREDRLHDP